MAELTRIIEETSKEALRIEEDCNYSAKSHFNASSTWTIRHYLIGIPATVFGAAAGAAMIKNLPELAGLLSLASTILTGLMTFLKPTERASSHKAAADQYLSLRNDARIFREIELIEMTKTTAILEGIKSLSKRRNSLNQGSPAIPRGAFEKARRGIEEGESTHEIDKHTQNQH